VSYLRLIINALWAGLYGACVVTLLLFLQNPDLAAGGIFSASFLGSLVSLGAAYVPFIAILLPSLFICVRFFAARRLGTSWINVKAIIWFSGVTLAGLTAAGYYNLRWTSSLIPPHAHDLLRSVCATMAGCTLIALCVASIAQFRPAEGRPLRIAAGCALLAPPLLIALLLPVAARSNRPSETVRIDTATAGTPSSGTTGSLLLVGVDAASMDYILPLASTRELPTFAALMKQGTSSRLNSIIPCVSRVAWINLLTGAPPWSSGIKGVRSYSLPGGAADVAVLPLALGLQHLVDWGYIGSSMVPDAARTAPTLWEILRWSGHTVHVLGFEGISEPAGSASEEAIDPAEVDRRLAALMDGAEIPSDPADRPLMEILRKAIAADLASRAAALDLRRPESKGEGMMVAVRFPGLGQVSRYFLRYHLPDVFGDVPERERVLFGHVLAGYYKMVDDLLAEQIDLAGEGAFVMVVSPHGVEPASGWRRLIGLTGFADRGEDAVPSGSWGRGPDGILLVAGAGVVSERKVDDADLVDVLPTALYALGQPIQASMRGDLLRRVFDRGFLETHPVHFIPGYGSPVDTRR